MWAAVADLGTDIYRERFKCLVSKGGHGRETVWRWYRWYGGGDCIEVVSRGGYCITVV